MEWEKKTMHYSDKTTKKSYYLVCYIYPEIIVVWDVGKYTAWFKIIKLFTHFCQVLKIWFLLLNRLLASMLDLDNKNCSNENYKLLLMQFRGKP